MDRNTLFITSQIDDPAFNLAAEEVFLRDHKEDIIFFYINKPSVIVGKHQNTLSEINLDYLEKKEFRFTEDYLVGEPFTTIREILIIAL